MLPNRLRDLRVAQQTTLAFPRGFYISIEDFLKYLYVPLKTLV